MPRRIRHHGFAHFLFIAALFFLAVYVFGGWTQGPVTSAVWIGLGIVRFMGNLFATGDLDAANQGATGLVDIVLAFVINVAIFYALSAVLIFIYNLFFGD